MDFGSFSLTYNPEFFVSQLFWLIVTFSFLLIFLWRISLPRISSVLEKRENKINNDIKLAKSLSNLYDGNYQKISESTVQTTITNNTFEKYDFHNKIRNALNSVLLIFGL